MQLRCVIKESRLNLNNLMIAYSLYAGSTFPSDFLCPFELGIWAQAWKVKGGWAPHTVSLHSWGSASTAAPLWSFLYNARRTTKQIIGCFNSLFAKLFAFPKPPLSALPLSHLHWLAPLCFPGDCDAHFSGATPTQPPLQKQFWFTQRKVQMSVDEMSGACCKHLLKQALERI